MRIFLIILAVLQFLFAGFAGAVGGFADGGEIWERAVLMGIHPLAAIGLLVLAVVPGLKPGGAKIVQFLLALNIVADGVLAALIYSGVTKGDWWLPLLFSIIPLIGLVLSFSRKVRG
jgi:hypothetical protein